MKSINWDEIRLAYITGSESLRSLAARFGVSLRETAAHSKSESWVNQREKHRHDVAMKAQQKISRAQEDELFRAWEKLDAGTKDFIEFFVQFSAAMKENPGEFVKRTQNPGREAESVAKIPTAINEYLQKRMHVLDPKDAEKLKLEREKLEMEKRKTEAQTNEDRTVRIVFDGATEEMSE